MPKRWFSIIINTTMPAHQPQPQHRIITSHHNNNEDAFSPVCPYVCLPVCLSVHLSACLSICLSACLSVCRPVCLPVYLSAVHAKWTGWARRGQARPSGSGGQGSAAWPFVCQGDWGWSRGKCSLHSLIIALTMVLVNVWDYLRERQREREKEHKNYLQFRAQNTRGHKRSGISR